ncbi:hypothetical protein BAE29_12620 [Acidithiobacillus caldus]|uniref:Uncharacterized protein n=1 Tax=Acidithiobacillus caldus TaxID=33059 RepID=A0A1E7YKS9_9PROT|nr:hypothetical protein BAE27_11350 [Acidithiobacillus caldus]OFC36593.1 hypothetical protein BAE29_12620 [Acidithiobacillus caldus]
MFRFIFEPAQIARHGNTGLVVGGHDGRNPVRRRAGQSHSGDRHEHRTQQHLFHIHTSQKIVGNIAYLV